MKFQTFVFVLLVMGLGACQSSAPPSNGLSDAEARAQTQRLLAMPAAAVERHFSGHTTRTFSSGHGTQIVYHAPNGRSYLWYPGNSAAVAARWEVRDSSLSSVNAEICYQYPTTSFNPVTRSSGGVFQCRPAALDMGYTLEIARGDPFGLASGTIPGVLPARADITMAQAAGLFGRAIPNSMRPAW